jgi:hypothetical protein
MKPLVSSFSLESVFKILLEKTIAVSDSVTIKGDIL